MPLYGRRTLGRPQIDTTSAEAVTGLIGLAMQFVAQGASDKLRLKEKKEAQSLTLLSEQYREVSNDLTRIEGEYDTSKRLYEATLGNLSPIDRTGGSDSVADDLSSFYTNKIEEKRTLKGRIENRLNQNYSEMADISRLQAGLATAVSPDAGIPKEYDADDFSTKRLAKIFNVDEALVKKYKTKQPEKIPAVIRSLEKLRLEAGVKTKGTGVLETKRIQDIQMTDISSRISNARMFQDMGVIAKNEDLNKDEQVKQILALGTEEGMSLGLILDPANEPKKGDSSKVIKTKRDAQYKQAMYLLNTFGSFTKTGGYKDVIGLGNFVNRLSKISDSLSSGVRPGFKKYVNDYFNIDLDKKEHFMLPGYILEEGVPVKGTGIKPIMEHSAEEVIAHMWENSGLSRTEFMKDEATMMRIQEIYTDLNPGMKNDEMDIRIEKLFNSLIGKKDKTT